MMQTQETVSKRPKRLPNGSCKQTQCKTTHEHPDHARVLVRLNRVAGQIRGVQAMVGDRRYCVDILTQLKAAQAALRAVEGDILQGHIESCVKEALAAKGTRQSSRKIQELVALLTT